MRGHAANYILVYKDTYLSIYIYIYKHTFLSLGDSGSGVMETRFLLHNSPKASGLLGVHAPKAITKSISRSKYSLPPPSRPPPPDPFFEVCGVPWFAGVQGNPKGKTAILGGSPKKIEAHICSLQAATPPKSRLVNIGNHKARRKPPLSGSLFKPIPMATKNDGFKIWLGSRK